MKLYVVGEEVFATRRPSSLGGDYPAGRPIPVSSEVRELAPRCGQVFGLCLYGLDVIEGPSGLTIVDLNPFPSYRNMPDVAPLIASYIEGYARGGCHLNPPEVPVPSSMSPGTHDATRAAGT